MIARRRSSLRLLIELYLAGIFDGLHVLLRIAKDLVQPSTCETSCRVMGL